MLYVARNNFETHYLKPSIFPLFLSSSTHIISRKRGRRPSRRRAWGNWRRRWDTRGKLPEELHKAAIRRSAIRYTVPGQSILVFDVISVVSLGSPKPNSSNCKTHHHRFFRAQRSSCYSYRLTQMHQLAKSSQYRGLTCIPKTQEPIPLHTSSQAMQHISYQSHHIKTHSTLKGFTSLPLLTSRYSSCPDTYIQPTTTPSKTVS